MKSDSRGLVLSLDPGSHIRHNVLLAQASATFSWGLGEGMMSGIVIGTTVQSPRVLLVLYNHNKRNSPTKEKYQSWVLCIKRGFQYPVCQWLHARFLGFCLAIPVLGIGLRPNIEKSDCSRVRSIPQHSRKILRYPGQFRSPIYYVKRNDINAVCSSLH